MSPGIHIYFFAVNKNEIIKNNGAEGWFGFRMRKITSLYKTTKISSPEEFDKKDEQFVNYFFKCELTFRNWEKGWRK